MRRSSRSVVAALCLLTLIGAALLAGPAESQAPRSGGTLKVMHREDTPQGFAVHETATISTVWPSSPCFNNLVYFDPFKPKESVDTIIGELAEKWSWQDNYRNLVFFLRKDVKWQHGEYIDYVKNPDYFVKGRPYLDGLRYVIVKERGTRTAALQAGQLDVAMAGETTKAAAEQIKAAVPKIVVTPVATNVTDNII